MLSGKHRSERKEEDRQDVHTGSARVRHEGGRSTGDELGRRLLFFDHTHTHDAVTADFSTSDSTSHLPRPFLPFHGHRLLESPPLPPCLHSDPQNALNSGSALSAAADSRCTQLQQKQVQQPLHPASGSVRWQRMSSDSFTFFTSRFPLCL